MIYYLPDSGLLIWHIDEAKWSYFYDNDYECSENPDYLCDDNNHPLVQLEQADGLQYLEAKVNRGDAGDPFPGTTNNRTFGTMTNPESSSYYGSREFPDLRYQYQQQRNKYDGRYHHRGRGHN